MPILHQVLHAVQGQLKNALGHPRSAGAVVAGLLLAVGLVWWLIVSRRPSAEEVERRRRELLASNGRIIDGMILEVRTLTGDDSHSPIPEVLVYSYRLAGVTYNCAQDVSHLPELVTGCRLDQPVQVRYDPRNPGNSVLVAESWSGLWQQRRR